MIVGFKPVDFSSVAQSCRIVVVQAASDHWNH